MELSWAMDMEPVLFRKQYRHIALSIAHYDFACNP
uniref:Uncharacterized protein n=1 Tax=Anguilla anguilla TaxID=7936 RepID=A0A0E9VR65_ANGAN